MGDKGQLDIPPIMIGLGHSLSLALAPLGPVVAGTPWILAGGAWNDTGVWDDAASWKDS